VIGTVLDRGRCIVVAVDVVATVTAVVVFVVIIGIIKYSRWNIRQAVE